MECARFQPERIRKRLHRLTREPRRQWRGSVDLGVDDFREAGVLIPITERDGEFLTVLTHRSEDLEEHSGEVSFPGGRPEIEDNSLAETAMREAYEEIALHPSDVEMYGALVEMPTVTGFRIVAYVGEFSEPYDLIPSPHEIESMFTAPLRELAADGVHRMERREFQGQIFPVHFFEYDGHTIWGATGFLLHTFLDYLGLIDPEEVDEGREGS